MEDLIFEVKRKLVHISSVIYIFIYYIVNKLFDQQAALLTLAFILIVLAFFEFLKMKFNKQIPFFHHLYRDNEKGTISGSVYLLMGITLSLAIFDFKIAVTSSLMMIFGDSVSAVVGRLGHKIDGLKTSWEGALSEFVIDMAVGFIFLTNIPIILIMAATATFVEIALKPIDDNLAVPLVSGFAGQAMMIILRVLSL